MRRSLILLSVFACLITGTSLAHAGLVVSGWSLTSSVFGQNDFQVQTLNTTSNPYNGTLHAQVENSYSHTLHDFSWTGDTGFFHLDSDHHMAQLDGSVGAGGLVNFSITSDSIISVSGRYDYSWPSNVFGNASILSLVYDYDDDVEPLLEQMQGGNVGLGPPFGSLTINASALLTGGHSYAFRYFAGTDVFNPSSPGTFGTATADITITITPVPEPAALAPLLCAALALIRRRASTR